LGREGSGKKELPEKQERERKAGIMKTTLVGIKIVKKLTVTAEGGKREFVSTGEIEPKCLFEDAEEGMKLHCENN